MRRAILGAACLVLLFALSRALLPFGSCQMPPLELGKSTQPTRTEYSPRRTYSPLNPDASLAEEPFREVPVGPRTPTACAADAGRRLQAAAVIAGLALLGGGVGVALTRQESKPTA